MVKIRKYCRSRSGRGLRKDTGSRRSGLGVRNTGLNMDLNTQVLTRNGRHSVKRRDSNN